MGLTQATWDAAVAAARAVWAKAGVLPASWPTEENGDSAAYAVLAAAGVEEPQLEELTTLANAEARLSLARELGLIPGRSAQAAA